MVGMGKEQTNEQHEQAHKGIAGQMVLDVFDDAVHGSQALRLKHG
jgi:hypothetical protein